MKTETRRHIVFETKKTLIVVYKDELLMNQLRKMIETSDDTDEVIIGTKDKSINIVSWTEQVWLDNKKGGNIQSKILFLGDIKGTDELIPVLDIKFDNYGVKYGFAGNQAVLFADTKALMNRKKYDEFLSKLGEMPVPEFLKPKKDDVVSDGKELASDETTDMKEAGLTEFEKAKLRKRADNAFLPAQKAMENGAEIINRAGNQLLAFTEELFRDKNLMKRQMLIYGVVHLYTNELDGFINQ